MSIGKIRLSPLEYLRQERAAAFKSEFHAGETFAMAGATHQHTRVKDNFARETGNQLVCSPCYVLTSDMRVKVDATGLYTYPDIVVVCGDPVFEDQVFDTLLNPAAIVEVLSDSTEKYDRGLKFGHYRCVPSIREYVLVSQDSALIERYVRQPDDSWLLTISSGLDGHFAFSTLNVKIALADVYRGISFDSK